jgi:hypothetical protein
LFSPPFEGDILAHVNVPATEFERMQRIHERVEDWAHRSRSMEKVPILISGAPDGSAGDESGPSRR